MFEMQELESRRMMSSATLYTSGSAKGMLIAVGDEGVNNVITIQLDTRTQKYIVDVNGTVSKFARSQVKQIYLMGKSGNDYLAVIDKTRQFTQGVHIFGRAGDDTLVGGSGPDTILGEDGNDLIQGGYGNDQLSGGNGDDQIYGGFQKAVYGDGNDTIWGDAGNDTLVGGSNFDLMYGGDGNDTMYGGTPGDTINRYGDASDDIFGGSGNDYMSAGFGRNRMHGEGGNDTLVGGSDSDTLYGGAGDNVVTGGGGKDLGATNGEWNRLGWFLAHITPLEPTEKTP